VAEHLPVQLYPLGSDSLAVTVTVNTSGLTPGAYTGILTFSSYKVSSRQYTCVTVQLTLNPSLSVTIAGPSELFPNQDGTWTALPAGGLTPYHYQWWYRYPLYLQGRSGAPPAPLRPPRGVWINDGTDSPQLTKRDIEDFEVKCNVTDAQPVTVTSNLIYVTVGAFARTATMMNPASDASARNAIVTEAELGHASPNPFNPFTTIRYGLPQMSAVLLTVFNTLGQEVAVLVQGNEEEGYHEVRFDGSNLASGVYYYRIQSGDFVQTRKLLLLR
jgi:hypothetical protein